jgi:glycosyltransferase involved in cell wall biosynthesis
VPIQAAASKTEMPEPKNPRRAFDGTPRRILISAYACCPNRGSEPAVGWNWPLELAGMGHEVWVITRSIFAQEICAELDASPQPRLHFVFYDTPRSATWWRFISGRKYRWLKSLRFAAMVMYYRAWQRKIGPLARQLHDSVRFDLAQHVTFGMFRTGSPLADLNVPFIFGPVGGGERAPWRLRWDYPLRGFLLDLIRDAANLLARVDPGVRRTLARARVILVTTPETQRCIPSRYWPKVAVVPAIGIDPASLSATGDADQEANREGEVRILCVSRLLYWKGLHLAIRGFAQFRRRFAGRATMTIIGIGPDRAFVERTAIASGVADWIRWISSVADYKSLLQIYSNHDVLLFPSLHDSGGMVVYEAMAAGLPVVCLNLGGPAMCVDQTWGRAVIVNGRTAKEVCDGIAESLVELAVNPSLKRRLSAGARAKAATLSWHRAVGSAYQRIGELLNGCP